jgi:hypothetical protein
VCQLDESDVVRLLKAAVEREGQSGFAIRHGVDRSLVHRILKDERPVSDSIEKALGLRMVKVYVAE